MRLATFNILHGRSVHDGRVGLDRLAAAVRVLDPDVLGLQEVDRDQPRSHLADLTHVCAEAMGAVAYRFVAALEGTPGGTWTAASAEPAPGEAAYGIALLSRYPARRWRLVRLPRIRTRVPLWLRDSHRWTVVRDEPRVAVVGDFETPVGPMLVANTHLSFLPGWGRVQLRRVARELRSLAEPVVILGDLNLPSPAPERIMGYRSLATLPTFPGDSPYRQLDHILLRGDLGDVVSAQAPLLGLSDHRALVVETAPRPAPEPRKRG